MVFSRESENIIYYSGVMAGMVGIFIAIKSENQVAISYSTIKKTLTVETSLKKSVLNTKDLTKPEINLLEKLLDAGVDKLIRYERFTPSERRAVAELRPKLPDPLGISCEPSKGYCLSV